MKYILTSLTILLTLGSVLYLTSNNAKDDDASSEFKQFLKKYKKSYGTSSEFDYRFHIFKNNYELIKENSQHTESNGFGIGINVFADLTFDEFKNMFLIGEKFFENKNLKKGSEKIDYDFNDIEPRQVDHEEILTPVQNQGSCGSCWAFSAIGSLESHLVLSKYFKTPTKLSEQHLVDCSKNGNEGCNGGLMDLAYDYLLKDGSVLEADYKYKGRDENCKIDNIPKEKRINIKGYECLTEEPNTKGLVKAIKKGPVAVAIQVTMFFQFYKFGIYKSLGSTGGSLNHGVVATAYYLDHKTPYLTIKNSWGSMWGKSGFAYLAIGDRKWGTLGVANESDCYPVLE